MRHLALLFSGTLILSAADAASSQKSFVDDFEKHWKSARQLAVAVAEAMPAESYAFKPTPEEMSFGEQMVHITESVFGYCAFSNFAEAKSPYKKPAQIEKETTVKNLGEAFDYCSGVIKGMPEGGLEKAHGQAPRQFNTREVLFGLLVHMAHHRGQAEVYLRLKGITPPPYKW